MEPKLPDPITAAHTLQEIPDRVRMLSDSFQKALQKGRQSLDRREYQILGFVNYIGVYADDLTETYRARRIDSLAQAMRNLLELSVWAKYCELSTENSKRFFDDGLRDMREVMETLQKAYTKANKEPQKMIEAILTDMKIRAPGFKVENLDASYLRVSDAAREIGREEEYSVFYKIASKFAHPTALLLAMQEPSKQGMLDSVFEIGVKLADRCLGELEKSVKTSHGGVDA